MVREGGTKVQRFFAGKGSSSRELWLRHHDGIRGYERWEDRFDAELADRFGVKPKKSTVKRVVMNRPPSPPTPPTPPPQASMKAPTADEPRPPSTPVQIAPPAAATLQGSSTEVSLDIASFKTVSYSRKVLRTFAERFGLKVEDMSEDGGNLWVRTDDSHLGINAVLLRWGFKYRNARKGWWLRG